MEQVIPVPFFSIGAEVRALYPQQRGTACQGRPSDALLMLSEESVVLHDQEHGAFNVQAVGHSARRGG